ncbi:hypothetical protein RhiirC2_796597 [Rhizophagus irregularis]|uniref:Uncharacterized protein n=1 Tax=Rhizophagus irregularis TaxID=588596 RepID=A0A2N1M9F1_9GLOM|nr:hypothetical protein RhiirC2_796597 [Rhizophagus irregularis]
MKRMKERQDEAKGNKKNKGDQKRMKYSSLESSQQDESNGSKIAFLGLIQDLLTYKIGFQA